MIIDNLIIYKDNNRFEKGSLRILNDRFADIEDIPADEKRMDGHGYYAIPGLIDIHFHGCMGVDLCDGNSPAIQQMATYEASVGVTSIVPASMTIPLKDLHTVMRTVGNYQSGIGSKLLGINMEGPFVSKEKKGAQAEENILKCDVRLFHELQKESDYNIRYVDIAPETEGAMDFIKRVKDEVIVSLAHTTANYSIAHQAYLQGARHATHLFNAMSPFTHREPGVVGAAFDANDSMVELICDGIHIHPSVVRAAFQMFGYSRIILVSDSMRATGLQDGNYTLGGQEVCVTGKRAILKDGTIAGSVTNLMDCLRTVVKEMQIPFESAIACATANPAKELGIYEQCGSITSGKFADLVLLDQDLNLKLVLINGRNIDING